MERPLYDGDNGTMVFSDAEAITVRRPNNYLGETFSYTTMGGVGAPRNQIVSPRGGNLTLGLADSHGNSTGTFGVVDIRIPAANGVSSATQVWKTDSSGNMTLSGYAQLDSLTHAGIQALTPAAVGQIYQCSDCGTVPVCISTGTAAGAWSIITNKGSACQ